MKLLYVLLADHAFLSVDKKVNIIGIFETINAAKFPITHPKFVVIGSIIPDKTNFKLSVNLTDDNGKSLMNNVNEKEINLPTEGGNRNFNFIIEMINPSFPQAGEYKVAINIDGKKLGEQTLRVLGAQSTGSYNLADLKPS
jgi:hypothetical protein